MFNGDMEERMEYIKYFVNDSRELLDDAEPQIIAMEEKALSSGEVDREVLNTIFRLFHSLKGSASFLDLQTVTRITHEAETLLDLFRKGQAVINGKHVNLLIRTSDFIRKILNTVETQLSDEEYAEGAGEILEDYQKSIDLITKTSASPNGLEQAGFDEHIITAEMNRRFFEEASEHLDKTEKMLLVLEKSPENLEYADQAFRSLHSFKGNAGFFGYRELEVLSHHAETLLDRIREGEKACDSKAVSFLLIAVDALREGAARVESSGKLEVPGMNEIIAHLDRLAAEPGGNNGEKVCGADECNPEHVPNGGYEKPAENENEVAAPATQILRQVPKTGNSGGGNGEGTGPSGGRNKQPLPAQQVIRVDLEKLDRLLDLVGELVIAEAMVANNQDLKGMELGGFEKAVLQLDKITRDIQEVAMSMRMVPLAGTFRKMVRLVRDLTQKESKKVNLEIIGEDTEVDKTVIEQISDPLVHLIRNAVDHGIESPGERSSLGKPETGKVTITAKHAAGDVWIIVEDDGKGLDREKILRKGMEHGLIRSDGWDLKDEEVWELIFEPGFSTAGKITSISGRGVGMDVVKRNIEKLGGKVNVRSKTGAGTMFAVRIPLTLAIIEGMVVKVGNCRYTIPIGSIKESIQPVADQITMTPGDLEVVRIRGEMLPVVRLHELYKVPPKFTDLTEGILIVVENNEKKGCLFVDELLGQQQVVIKGLSGYLGRVRSISGCAILGDGDVSMILDIADLLSSIEVGRQ
jgi:two-component system chemotaxis sensor kinase CheA